MDLLEPSVTQSSENNVYQRLSQNRYKNPYIFKASIGAYQSPFSWSVLCDLGRSFCQFFPSVPEPTTSKIQEYLHRFRGNNILKVEENINIWIDHLDYKFGSKASIAITNEDELLIYWQKDNDLFNILVDEDFEVEIIYIPSDRRKSQNRLLRDVRETTTETIKKAFDEMQRNN